MKKITFLTILLIALTAELISQSCLPEGITFSNQSMIDDFQNNYPDCEIIEGDVRITGDDISNLDGINGITGINGYLKLSDNPNLLNLSGLSNLTYIGDYLTIEENHQLTNFIGLNNLATIGGNFSVYINNQLTNFMGLDSLSSIGGYFDIMVNENLINCIGISNLSSVGSYISELTQKAIKTGEKIGTVEVDMGGTACKVPSSPLYIDKVKKRGSIGKKRKTARC